MTNQLFIELPPGRDCADSEPLHWLLWDDQAKQLRERGQCRLDELAGLAAQFPNLATVAIAPGELISRHQVVLPKGGRAGAAALPFQLEERLCAELGSVHLAHGAIVANRDSEVLVVEQGIMQRWHQLLTDSGLRITTLLPDYGAIAENVLVLDQQRAVSHTPSMAASCASESLSTWLQLASGGETAEAVGGLLAYQCGDVESLDLPSLAIKPVSQRLEAIAASFSPWAPNLLCGNFAIRDEQSALIKALRWPLALAVCLLLVHWLNLGLSVVGQNREIAKLEQAIDQVYVDTFPGARVVNARSQMRSKLNALEAGGSQSALMPWLEKVATASRSISGLRLTQLGFAGNPATLKLSVSAPSYGAVDNWVAALQAQGLEVERGTITAEGGNSQRVSGQLSIQGAR